jgi:hypothetical protein
LKDGGWQCFSNLPHAPSEIDTFARQGRYAAAILTTVLEVREPKACETYRILGVDDCADTAMFDKFELCV